MSGVLMFCLACIAASAALLLAPDVSYVFRLRPSTSNHPQIPAGESIPVLPSFDHPQAQDEQPSAASVPAGPLTPESRLEIIRYVSGEFAHMVTALPGSKDGFRIRAGEPIDVKVLAQAVRSSGAAVNAGDNVQITKIDFRDHEIALDINGGPRGRTSWRDRLQLNMGGPISTSTTRNTPTKPPPTGATVYLDFGRSLPNMSADDLKDYLAVLFDFSNQRSAAVQWVESLPSNIREAIEQERAEIGMDREQVIAALGKPDHKVRERQRDGTETEDWIYGYPPIKTIFVRFAGDTVVRVTEYL